MAKRRDFRALTRFFKLIQHFLWCSDDTSACLRGQWLQVIVDLLASFLEVLRALVEVRVDLSKVCTLKVIVKHLFLLLSESVPELQQMVLAMVLELNTKAFHIHGGFSKSLKKTKKICENMCPHTIYSSLYKRPCGKIPILSSSSQVDLTLKMNESI